MEASHKELFLLLAALRLAGELITGKWLKHNKYIWMLYVSRLCIMYISSMPLHGE